MTQANIELLNALREAGASDAASEAAARSVAASDQVATKADLAELRADLARMEARFVAYLLPVYALLAYLAIRAS